MASFASNIRKSQPMVFLSLAPTTSETQAASPAQQSVERPTARRSSSLSSTSSVQYRFLKLGPVQNGAHPDESQEDFHEVAIVE
ncbi:hypothetical protein TruAng_001798 [Truncatella angustata]|nr:hypothetical protein TruAng_001798 [Truncatella angustata]